MKKKIIRISTIPTSLRILLRGQLKFISQHFEIIAVSSNDIDFKKMLMQEEVEGVCVNMTRKITPIKDLVSLLKIIRIIRKEKPYFVHSHTPKAGTLSMVASWLCNVPVRMHTVAGLPLLEATGLKKKILIVVEKLTYAAATNIYPNSFVLKDIIIANKLTRIDKLKVICNGSSNGIDTFFFSNNQITNKGQLLRDELGFSTKAFVFCFVGRIVKDKGINELVHAFVKLNKEFENIKLLLVGPFEKDLDPVSEDVEEFILNHKGILFMNYQDDVRPFFAASDALVFPSYREGFPNVVLQAGAMGLPSIVTNINGCNEIIIEGENGTIIPPKDKDALFIAMKYFVEHKDDEVRKMAKNARPMILSRYEQTEVWNALLKEYQSLVYNK